MVGVFWIDAKSCDASQLTKRQTIMDFFDGFIKI